MSEIVLSVRGSVQVCVSVSGCVQVLPSACENIIAERSTASGVGRFLPRIGNKHLCACCEAPTLPEESVM